MTKLQTPYIVVVNGHIDPASTGDFSTRSTFYGYDSNFYMEIYVMGQRSSI